MQKTGYLLLNLGSPASPSVKDVRAYLGEFLMDKYVINLPWLLRKMIVSLFILPFRPKRSAHAYAQIWQPEGSPLLLISEAFCKQLSHQIDEPVVLAMRYGNPNIKDAVQALLDANVTHIVLVPLYPQHADSTVTTILEVCKQAIPAHITTSHVPAFYNNAHYIEAQSQVIREHLPQHWDHLLLSYHGIPEQHLVQADPTHTHCLNGDCCAINQEPAEAHVAHNTCYRHHVYTTSRKLMASLGISAAKFSVSFQSRLGRLPWLTPYTDQVLQQLPKQGIKHLVVASPAFVADNLETLEELNMQGRETFLAAGGETFQLIPCLNDHPAWIKAMTQILVDHTVSASSETS